MTTVHGASDTLEFCFFGEAWNEGNVSTGRPAPGCVVVMNNNCPTHHFAGGEALQEWLGEKCWTCSPDFNPVEFFFFQEKAHCYALWIVGGHQWNIACAVFEAVETIFLRWHGEPFSDTLIYDWHMKINLESLTFFFVIHKILQTNLQF